MSMNAALNATIALIENRPAQFREMLREPSSDVKSISPVYTRLKQALDFYAATKMRAALMASLHVQPPENVEGLSRTDIFFTGVRAVETIFESMIASLEEK